MNRKILQNLFSFLLFGSFTFFSQNVNSQAVAEIGAYPGSSANVVTGSAAFHASESIFLSSEVGATNFLTTASAINRIEFNVIQVGSPTLFNNYTVYLKEVPGATTTLAAGAYNLTGYTQVYSGSITFAATGWSGIDLTTPFVRTVGTNNVQVLITRTDGTTRTGYIYLAARGNAVDSSALTTRRYNGSTAPVAGTTSLTPSFFRLGIRLINKAANDAALATVSTPSSSCHSTVNIPVTIQNYGTAPIAAGAASVTLSLSGANVSSTIQTNSTAIAPGATGIVTFTGVNASLPGIDSVMAVVAYAGDVNALNDTIKSTFLTTSTTSTFPVTESAEDTPLAYFSYLKLITGSQAWALNSGKYKNVDFPDSLAPHSGNNFYYFDSWNIQVANGILYSNCFSFPPVATGNVYNIKFWMSHDTSFNTSLDSMFVVVSADKGVTWNRVGVGFQRYNPTFITPGWQQETVDLTAYAGQTIQIGFEGVSQYGNIIGIDDIVITANDPLPVKLLYFKGQTNGSANQLSWATATEINSKGFELQRSVDGVNFSKLSFINSKGENGNSNRNLQYEFSDNKPFATSNYYRLKQTDKDGKFEYSNVVMLKGVRPNTLSVAALYPNPAVDKLNLLITSPANSKVTVVVTDLAGKIVLQNVAQLVAGDNNLQLNLKAIAKGSYSVKVMCSDGCNSPATKFVKQ